MTTKYGFVIIVAVALIGFGLWPASARAQGPSGSFVSGIACLNLSSTTTAAAIDFYQENGTKITTVANPDFVPNSPWLLFTPSITELNSGFLGSAVLSAGQEVACSVNTQNTPGTGTVRVGTSEGVIDNEASPKLYATQIVNALGNFDSYVAVQNIEETETEVQAVYLDRNGAVVGNETVTIQPNSSHVFYQDNANLPSNFIGSATFSATDNSSGLVGAVALYNTVTAQLLSFNTFTSGADKVYLPRLAKNLSGVGYTSGWACQNLGPDVADMEMQITMFDQDTQENVQATLTRDDVGVNQSWLVYIGDPTGSAIDNINRGFGSAIVTATGGQIACTANEDNRSDLSGPNASLNGQGSTYGGVPDGAQSATMYFPQIVALGATSFQGGFQIANTTATATDCTYTFSNGDTVTQPLAANGSNSVFANTVLVNDQGSFNGSASVTCGQPIVGIYNLSIFGSSASGDPFSTNNGIGQR